MKRISGILFLAAQTLFLTTLAGAQTFSVIRSFGASTPEPAGATYAGLIAQGRDGNLYTASSAGGKTNQGAIYKITPSGTLTVLYSFDSTHGKTPSGGLSLGADGNFYGTTQGGGLAAYGTIFKITPAGVLTVLHNFTRTEGGEAYGPPVLAGDGNYYGTTSYYGSNYYGSIYRLTPAGAFSVIHQFGTSSGAGTGGSSLSPLTLGPDGNLYGTTTAGGQGNGVVFRISTAGTYSVVYNFQSTSGDLPYNGVSFGADGYLYGSTPYGGANSRGVAFRLSTGGAYKVLHAFGSGTADGKASYSGLVAASDGNYYGTAQSGGSASDGTLFRVSAAGAYATMHTFQGADGKQPQSALVQTTDGSIYGQTFSGGVANAGEVFKLTGVLKPFVKPLLPFGKVGTSVQILGQGFVQGSTTVSFGGKVATSVTVQSPTFLTVTIPTGAVTGTLTVKTGTSTFMAVAPFKIAQ